MRRRRGPAVRLHAIIGHPVVATTVLPRGVHLVNFRELSAVVTDLPIGTRGPVVPDAAAHGAIIRPLFAQQSIIPLQPGVVFRRSDTLANWLELHYAALHDALAYIEGRVEARVHIRPAEARGGTELERGPDSTRTGLPLFSALAVDICHEVGREATAWMLLPRSQEARAAGVPAPVPGLPLDPARQAHEASSAGDDLSERWRDVADISASFLVDRSRWREFAGAVATEVGRQPAVQIRLTGPWPP